ncbi:MAG: pyruvate formate lyase-activating protein [Erysipelotrichia bacterium]|nr:pyruvate formate lyase-activating protein [Erysipelotrichia bacterium]NCC53994.1 pyruvate formate lyase-activating protein [Erysipelotrichia bacterium]
MNLAKIHSFESFGTVDGPGVRFVVFMQGCPLRCKYCHNPDTWDFAQGKEYSAKDVYKQIMKYINYIRKGGVTVSGGEPLAQIDFVIELFTLLKNEGLHTCCDTSGIYFNPDDLDTIAKYDELLKVCDLFLLDIKHIDEDKHKALTGLSASRPKAFAKYLDEQHKPVWIRHVLVDTYTNNIEDLEKTRSFIDTLHNVEKVEVLPYHTLGVTKYEKLGIAYPLKDVQAPSKQDIERAKKILGVKTNA